MTTLLLPAPRVLQLPGITRVVFQAVGPWTCSTGEEIGRRDPQRPVGYLLGSGRRVQRLWSSGQYGITIMCRAPKAHRLCTLYRCVGYDDDLWINPHRNPLRVTTWGIPPKSVTLEHACGLRLVNTPVNLGKVRAMLSEMERSGCIEIRSVRW